LTPAIHRTGNVLDDTVICRNMQRHRHQEFINFCDRRGLFEGADQLATVLYRIHRPLLKTAPKPCQKLRRDLR
jgi:hypothetical protein